MGPTTEVQQALDAHSLSTVGYQDYGRRLVQTYGDGLPAAVVLVASTVHYSWEKIVRTLGVGSNQLVYIPVDERYRMDPDALWERVQELSSRQVPILACISVCGSTEESAVDRLDQVLEVRRRAEEELGVTFHIHSDAAYGGYAAAVTQRGDGTRRSASEIREVLGDDWPAEEWLASIKALGEADSVTIDPHKLGYVPYPAGAFLLRDRRARELVATDPPYILAAEGTEAGEDLVLGRFIFEGSKPGAAAASVWLSHKVLPLDERGYGYLIERTMVGARLFHEALSEAELDPFRIIMLPEPDINIVCFVVHHPSLETLEATNTFNERIYAEMSLSHPGATPDYIVSRTRFQTPMYDGAVDPILEELGIATAEEWRAAGSEGLVVLRSTVMDPFLADPPPAPDHIGGFINALERAAQRALQMQFENGRVTL